MPKLKLVTVVWEDACNYPNKGLEEIKKMDPEMVETYGVLIKTKKYHIVMTHNSHGECNDYVRIPSSLVREVR